MKRSALIRVIRCAFLILLCTLPAAATVTVTGHVKIGDTTTPGANVVRVHGELIRCVVAGQNTPRVIGVTNFKPSFDVTTFDGTGAFTVTTYGNDVITCDQAGNSRWRVYQYFSDGTSQYNVYQFTDGVAANLDTLATDNSAATTYVANAVVTNPNGDQTVVQPGSTFLNVNRLNCTGTCTGFGGGFTLNGLATNPQTFAPGTSGSDFGISSVGSTHTFNIPTAANGVRGLLSSADWNTFNNKMAAIAGNTLAANFFANSINAAGVISGAQPAVANLSDSKTGTLGSLVLSNGPTITKITVNQDANGNDLFFGQRFADSGPTGNLIYFKNAANNADLFKLDVAGVMTMSNNLIFQSDNSFDIGASAANRPRTVFAGTSFIAPVGAVGTPGFAFAGNTNTGFWSLASNGIFGSVNGVRSWVINANGMAVGSTAPIGWSTTADAGGANCDTCLVRDGVASTLALTKVAGGPADQHFRIYGANAGYAEHGVASELITLSTSGTTTDSVANLLPANAIIGPVDCRVTTTITTATNWSVGDATTGARFSPANGTLTAGTTSVGLTHVDQTGAAGPKQTAAAKLRITTTGTPGAGAIRCAVNYTLGTPPTS